MTFNFVELPVQIKELDAFMSDGMRFYQTPDGKTYPSVTSITSFQRAQFFKEWREKVGEEYANRETSRATGRGTAFHGIIESYLKNESNYLIPDVPLPNYLFKVSKPTIDRISNIHLLEAPLYSDYLGLAGRVDCIAEFDGELAVIDFKTANKDKKEEWIENYFVQETAYAAMFLERTGIEVKKIVTIIATEEGNCQVFEKYDLDYYLELLKEYIHAFVRSRTTDE